MALSGRLVAVLSAAAVILGVVAAGRAAGSEGRFEPGYAMSKQYVAVTVYKILRDHAPGTVGGCERNVKDEPDRFGDLDAAGAFTRGSINCLDKLGYLSGLPGGSGGRFEPGYEMSKQYVAVTVYKILRDHAPGTVGGCERNVKDEPDRFGDLGAAGAFTRGSINCLDKLGYLSGLPGGSSTPGGSQSPDGGTDSDGGTGPGADTDPDEGTGPGAGTVTADPAEGRDYLPARGGGAPPLREGTLAIPVFICAPAGAYASADLSVAVRVINADVGDFFKRQSSNQVNLNFVEGSIVSPNIEWDNDSITRMRVRANETTDPHPCLKDAIGSAETKQVLVLVNLPLHIPGDGQDIIAGYARYGQYAVAPLLAEYDGSLFTGAILHEIAHSVFHLAHVDDYGTIFNDGKMACYQRMALGWPVGENSPECYLVSPGVTLTSVLPATNQITINWKVDPSPDGTTATGYKVTLYRDSDIVSEFKADASSRSHTFNNLPPLTEHKVVVTPKVPADAYLYPFADNERTIRTLGTGVRVTYLGPFEIDLEWDPYPGAFESYTIGYTQYDLHVTEQGLVRETYPSYGPDIHIGRNPRTTIDHLLPDQEYTFEIGIQGDDIGYDDDGKLAVYNTVTVKTPPLSHTVPDPPTPTVTVGDTWIEIVVGQFADCDDLMIDMYGSMYDIRIFDIDMSPVGGTWGMGSSCELGLYDNTLRIEDGRIVGRGVPIQIEPNTTYNIEVSTCAALGGDERIWQYLVWANEVRTFIDPDTGTSFEAKLSDYVKDYVFCAETWVSVTTTS